MRKIFLLLCSIAFAKAAFSQDNFPYEGKTVIMKSLPSEKTTGDYVAGNNSPSNGIQVYQMSKQPDFNSEQWKLIGFTAIINNVSQTRYRIYNVGTQSYVTMPNTAQTGLPVQLAPEISDWNRMLVFQSFDFQKQADGNYIIHSLFHYSVYDYILAGFNANDGTAITTAFNSIAYGTNREFVIEDLNPAVNPSSAVASLEDQFQGCTVGILSQQSNDYLQANATSDLINTVANLTDFNQKFKIEYTDETGWYKIKDKASGKYVTVIYPVDDGDVELRPAGVPDDDHQKFKFIFQSANTYEIHSKYSYGPSATSVGLVLEMADGDNNAPMKLGKNASTNNPWQVFVLNKYEPEAAEFTNGTQTNSAEKILGKQYYISNFESLALLEPYVVNGDTLVRVQPHPVYGDQSEWTIDDDTTRDGNHYYRIRYGKTDQYLYLPVATQNTNPGPNVELHLKKNVTHEKDYRYEFAVGSEGTIQHTFNLYSGAGNYLITDNKFLVINDDGYLATENSAQSSTFGKNKSFIMNLSLPSDGTKTYSISLKGNGHFVSDSGILKSDGAAVVQAAENDYSCNWHFIPTGNEDEYYIKSNLTGQFLSSANSSANSAIVAVQIHGDNNTRWKLSTSGNYYKIKNVASNYYLATNGKTQAGKPLYQTIGTGPGALWIISRSDYFPDALADPIAAAGLLGDYQELDKNPFNDGATRNDMMKSIGLPYEPSYEKLSDPLGLQLNQDGFNPSNPPSFYPVLQSALKYKFNYTSNEVNEAMQNFKLDSPGHRVEMAYALRSYILEKLASEDRSTWTYNESELVKWIERKIDAVKKSYGDRLQTSWANFKTSLTLDAGGLPFDVLLGPDLDYTKWQIPDYYITTPDQSESLLEYSAICKEKNFLNPHDLESIGIPPLAIAGTSVLVNEVVKATFVAGKSAAQRAAQKVLTNLVEECADADEIASAAFATDYSSVTAASRFASSITSASSASFIASVVIVATQVLIMRAVDGVKFDNFETQLDNKIYMLQHPSTRIDSIMNAPNLLNQFYLCQDMDYILGTGQRFSSPYAILPVTLTNFNAALQQQNVQLSWNTSSEHNNAFFTLERSLDGKTFTTIAKVPGANTSSIPHDYNFTDYNVYKLSTATLYYRLKQTDNDGKVTTFQIRKVSLQNKLFVSTIGPNPFNNELTFRLNVEKEEKITIRLFNEAGKLIYSSSHNAGNGISAFTIGGFRNLASGIYIIEVTSGNDQLIKKELLKN